MHDWKNYKECKCGEPGCFSYNPDNMSAEDLEQLRQARIEAHESFA